MKFRITAQPKAKKAEREPKSLAPSLLDDPAFSADPHSHPDFVTSHEPEWTTSPPVGHPPLKKTRRRRILVTDENLTDTEFPLIQPPNTPAPPSSAPTDPPSLPVPPDVLRQVPALNNHHPPAASTAPSSLPKRAPTSILSIDPDPAPQPPKHEKKGGLMTFLTRRKTTPSPAAPPAATPRSKKLQAHRSLVPDLPNDVTRPPAPRQISEPIKPPTQGRPPMAVSTAASAAGSSASKRHAGGANSRLQDLDKIDELDETNPWGISLHHKGPYEAAVQAIKQNSKRGPLGLADNPNDHHLRAMHANGRPYVPPQAPIGVSLNLSPGQILPRNFHLQHNQHPRQRDKPEPQIRPLIVQQAASSLKNAYQQPKSYVANSSSFGDQPAAPPTSPDARGSL
ncbi:unnamed protein product [Cyclocybe aegerita]|uniref:Uncharacterized protein n=1 Tax=Cyclocybe aegerita TaxID=1973307 RepID=A0A8S0XPS7_CYCAE|nr:unnamed protein product [Cyclocybe aegerita]